MMIRRQLLKPRDPWERLGPDDAKRVDVAGRFDFFWVVLDGVFCFLDLLLLPLLWDETNQQRLTRQLQELLSR